MNIRVGHCLKGFGRDAFHSVPLISNEVRDAVESVPTMPPRHPVQDIQFRVRGPVVTQLQEVFADDWQFTTGESLRGDSWFPKPEAAGQVLARGVPDGPDEDFEKLRWTLLGAISIARYSVRIVTPYFLPDPPLVSALNLAAMRGVQVDIILPAKSNLPFVGWASRARSEER